MLEGDEYEDQLLGDPNQLDDIIEARELDPLEDEEEHPADDQDQEQGDGDDEKVKPRRRVQNPRPKLDAFRLTGPRGIAVIENLFADYKFYGPGYEARDLKRIMQRFELWGNRLFPKYQFDDLLEKVEKLGHKKPVLNFVNKIRMGIVTEDTVAENRTAENDIIDMVDNDEVSNDVTQIEHIPNEDAFDQLLSEQLTQISSQRSTQHNVLQFDIQRGITDEQRQRMLQNRLLAEQRRLARLKVAQEKTLESNSEINSPVASKISPSNCKDIDGLTGDSLVACVADKDHTENNHKDSRVEKAETFEENIGMCSKDDGITKTSLLLSHNVDHYQNEDDCKGNKCEEVSTNLKVSASIDETMEEIVETNQIIEESKSHLDEVDLEGVECAQIEKSMEQ